ncbi:MAG: arylsulfatase, partial [Planctomycetota bacterium]
NWKGIRQNVSRNPDAPIEIYDLASDVGEKRNIASKHADVVAKIGTILKIARTKSDRFPLHRKGRGKGKKKR